LGFRGQNLEKTEDRLAWALRAGMRKGKPSAWFFVITPARSAQTDLSSVFSSTLSSESQPSVKLLVVGG
ncbi:MAG: hypothetical protein LBD06_05865, partial [Candidatus Accumulibacter sp.]|nr:hypothetical protein [Accumulibacter sp.]